MEKKSINQKFRTRTEKRNNKDLKCLFNCIPMLGLSGDVSAQAFDHSIFLSVAPEFNLFAFFFCLSLVRFSTGTECFLSLFFSRLWTLSSLSFEQRRVLLYVVYYNLFKEFSHLLSYHHIHKIEPTPNKFSQINSEVTKLIVF